MFKTLLVDDEESILRFLALVLKEAGFEVVTATSAQLATSILEQGEKFDIIVTDLRMESPLAGFQVVKVANKAVPRPIIVVLTAFPVPPADWRNAGADALYMKGNNTMMLPEQLKELLKRHVSKK